MRRHSIYTRGACTLLLAMSSVLAFGMEAHAQDSGARYNQANELYRKGRFEAAAQAYGRLAQEGVANGHLYYNLGNAWFKSGHLGRAVLWYERARRLLPADEDILVNLRFAQARRVDREEEEDLLPVIRTLTEVYRSMDPDGLSLMCTLMLWGAGGVGILWLFRPERRNLLMGLMALLIAGWAGSGVLTASRSHDLTIPGAVILAEEALGRSGPAGDYLEVFSLHEGTLVTVERAEGGWVLVRLPNGLGGWIRAEDAERI